MHPAIRSAVVALLVALTAASAAAQSKVPSIDDLLNLRTVGGQRISPDGKWVAYTTGETDWTADAFITQVWVVNLASGERRQLTTHPKGAGNIAWSRDGKWVSFTSTREENRSQLYVIRPDGGEAIRLTKSETPVGSYKCHAKARRLPSPRPIPKPRRRRRARRNTLRSSRCVAITRSRTSIP